MTRNDFIGWCIFGFELGAGAAFGQWQHSFMAGAFVTLCLVWYDVKISFVSIG